MNDREVSPTVRVSACIWSAKTIGDECADLARSAASLDERRALLSAEADARTLEARLREVLRYMGSELHPDGRLSQLSTPGLEVLDFDEPEEETEPWK